MTAKSKCSAAAMSLALVAGAGPLSGCAGLRESLGMKPPQRRVPPPATPAAAVERPDDREQALLAAVEDFLERTSEYQIRNEPPAAMTHAASSSTPAEERPSVPFMVNPTSEPQPTRTAAPAPNGVFANTHVTLNDRSPKQPPLAIPAVRMVSIRTTPATDAPPDEPSTAPTTNQAVEMSPPADEVSADQFVKHLESKAAEANDFDTTWQLRLVQLALNRIPETVPASPDLSPDARAAFSSEVRL